MGILDTIEAGSQIDSYRIEAPVARSGMASIFRAVDMRDNRVVALKIPHPDMEADPILFDRFKREAEIGEKLNHPMVMRVYGGEKRSRIYMVMEWCEGTAAAPRFSTKAACRRTAPSASPSRCWRRSNTFTNRAWCIAT